MYLLHPVKRNKILTWEESLHDNCHQYHHHWELYQLSKMHQKKKNYSSITQYWNNTLIQKIYEILVQYNTLPSFLNIKNPHKTISEHYHTLSEEQMWKLVRQVKQQVLQEQPPLWAVTIRRQILTTKMSESNKNSS